MPAAKTLSDPRTYNQAHGTANVGDHQWKPHQPHGNHGPHDGNHGPHGGPKGNNKWVPHQMPTAGTTQMPAAKTLSDPRTYNQAHGTANVGDHQWKPHQPHGNHGPHDGNHGPHGGPKGNGNNKWVPHQMPTAGTQMPAKTLEANSESFMDSINSAIKNAIPKPPVPQPPQTAPAQVSVTAAELQDLKSRIDNISAILSGILKKK